ncbi:MAG TPA: alpha/beta hydrolase [Xanthobacteraceae bacterium]|jgi:pimeloyl-ACP methyl ester carboxylesterase|nr:alpha/beta hydrolase [Xanthobacteraceae bacterium]
MRPETHFVVSNPAGRPALLLLHPMGANHHFWDACTRIWSERFQVVACDLRGAGQSPVPDRPWKVEDHVRDIIAIREHLGLSSVVPIGCAVGSLIAASYAAADAPHVSALVLSNTAPRLGAESRARAEKRVALVRRNGIGALLPDVVDLAFSQQPRDARYLGYMEMFRGNNPNGYAAIALGMIGTDVSAALSAITCPSLVMVGAHDRLLPPGLSRAVHEMLRGSEFEILEHAAHFAPYQDPEIFSARVNDFLRRKGIA